MKGVLQMLLNTRHFGEIEIDENSIIQFDEGLLGFEHIKQYIIVENPDPELPFHWLQAVDEPWLAFVVTSPFLFKPDYAFDIPDQTTQQLEIEESEDATVYSIAVVPEDIKKMTINLSGPILINRVKKKGRQVVIDSSEYPTKFFVFQQV